MLRRPAPISSVALTSSRRLVLNLIATSGGTGCRFIGSVTLKNQSCGLWCHRNRRTPNLGLSSRLLRLEQSCDNKPSSLSHGGGTSINVQLAFDSLREAAWDSIKRNKAPSSGRMSPSFLFALCSQFMIEKIVCSM